MQVTFNVSIQCKQSVGLNCPRKNSTVDKQRVDSLQHVRRRFLKCSGRLDFFGSQKFGPDINVSCVARVFEVEAMVTLPVMGGCLESCWTNSSVPTQGCFFFLLPGPPKKWSNCLRKTMNVGCTYHEFVEYGYQDYVYLKLPWLRGHNQKKFNRVIQSHFRNKDLVLMFLSCNSDSACAFFASISGRSGEWSSLILKWEVQTFFSFHKAEEEMRNESQT